MNTLNPSQRSPYPGMPPLRNGMRAPLPEGVRTAANLTAAIRDLYRWAGEPTLRELKAQAPGTSRSALDYLLTGSHPVAPDVLHAFVKACGAIDDWPWWVKSWDTVRSIERTRELTQGKN